jgi:hypothetical protein
MRLGLYYDLRNPGAARPWARVYAAALDRIAWAGDAGIGGIWVTEHHGFADGWRASEFPAFGAEYARRYEALEEAVRLLPELWDSGRVTPAPVQRPLPVWVGARGPRGARLAGRAGAGLLWIDPDLMKPYLAGLAAGRAAAFPKLRILTPAAAAKWIAELCAGLPVTDVFCFGDIGGLPDDLVNRHTGLAVRELTPLLAEGEL